MSRLRGRRSRLWQAGAVAVVGALTVALTQSTTTAAFTARTDDTGNRVTAATSFCTSPGSTAIVVTNDTWVNQADASTPYGSATTLTVRSAASANAHAYLRFTLPPPPARCRLTAATLRLYATTSQGPGTVDVHRASSTWDPATATWNMANRPQPLGTRVGTAAGAAGWHQWTVTTLVGELYAGPNEGFLVKDRVDDASPGRATTYETLNSATVANRPQLLLTWG